MPSDPQTPALRPIDELLPYARNSLKHPPDQVASIAASIEQFGMAGAIVVRKNTIAKGHGTLAAIRSILAKGKAIYPIPGESAGAEPYPPGCVPVLDASGWTDSQFRAYVITDNQTGRSADWDMDALAGEVRALEQMEFDTTVLGFDVDEMDRILGVRKGKTDPDLVPPSEATLVSRSGDVWILGKHRLMCGDSRKHDQMATLMKGDFANMVFTDPPYGVNIISRVGTRGVANSTARIQSGSNAGVAGGLGIENDDLTLAQLTDFLSEVFDQTFMFSRPGAAWYICAPSNTISLAFSIVLEKIGVWKHTIVWVKDSLVLGRADYHYRHEPIYYGWKPGGPHHAVTDRKQDTVWEFPRPKKSLEHPTMKPVELVIRAITNSSNVDELVLEQFSGSGTTIVACEQTGRRCYAMELMQKYVDVGVRRWQNFTGATAFLEGDGRTFAEIENDRKPVEA